MKLRRSLLVFLLIFTMTIGVNAMGGVFNIKTQKGIKQVCEYMGLTFQQDGKTYSGTIVDIFKSQHHGKDMVVYTIQYKEDPDSDDELISISSDESEEIVVDAG